MKLAVLSAVTAFAASAAVSAEPAKHAYVCVDRIGQSLLVPTAEIEKVRNATAPKFSTNP